MDWITYEHRFHLSCIVHWDRSGKILLLIAK